MSTIYPKKLELSISKTRWCGTHVSDTRSVKGQNRGRVGPPGNQASGPEPKRVCRDGRAGVAPPPGETRDGVGQHPEGVCILVLGDLIPLGDVGLHNEAQVALKVLSP